MESREVDYYEDSNLAEMKKSVWDGNARDLKFWIENDLEFRLPDEIPDLNDPLPPRPETPEEVDQITDQLLSSEVESKEPVALGEIIATKSSKGDDHVFKKPVMPPRKQRSSPELSLHEVKPKNKPDSFENRGAPSFGQEWKPDNYRSNRADYRSRRPYADNRSFPNKKVPFNNNNFRNNYSKELTRGGSDIRQKYSDQRNASYSARNNNM